MQLESIKPRNAHPQDKVQIPSTKYQTNIKSQQSMTETGLNKRINPSSEYSA
jgi:hypothetical protein